MIGKALLTTLNSAAALKTLAALYGADAAAGAQIRYTALVEGLLAFGEKPATGMVGSVKDVVIRDFPETAAEVRLFSAPGRTELGGNHTDHNNGKVLAASIQLDAVAAAARRSDHIVVFRSTGYPDVVVDLANLAPDPAEKGTTEALIRGIAAELTAGGTPVKGFIANADSTVLPGSGLSSSAAVEILLGKIFDSLYGEGKRPPLELARIGQKAENDYFGKPSGLMDQCACAYGGAVAIDFGDPENPRITQLTLDLNTMGYILCVVNTRGSHADLTDDYAAIPNEMKAVARFFGKNTLREITRSQVLENAAALRERVGDRAILRAMHYFSENNRVDDMKITLEKIDTAFDPPERQGALGHFLDLVNESGNSSWELLQNSYSPKKPADQGIALALELTRHFFSHRGTCRVHGGGFAGTIQAYVPLTSLDGYRAEMESVFGKDAVTVIRIRPIGVTEITV
jgi:galactokinase